MSQLWLTLGLAQRSHRVPDSREITTDASVMERVRIPRNGRGSFPPDSTTSLRGQCAHSTTAGVSSRLFIGAQGESAEVGHDAAAESVSSKSGDVRVGRTRFGGGCPERLGRPRVTRASTWRDMIGGLAQSRLVRRSSRQPGPDDLGSFANGLQLFEQRLGSFARLLLLRLRDDGADRC